jgi:hypothetical protein
MNTPLAINYDLVGTGWSTCVVEVGDKRVELSASDLSDALANLLVFALTMASGFHSSSFGFDEEPGEYRWVAEAIDVNRIRLRILSFDALWSHKQDSEGKVLVELELSPLVLAQVVYAAAEAVLEKYGADGYAEKWSGSFPERELSLLRSAIEQWRT